jgi:acetylornithine deacetylase
VSALLDKTLEHLRWLVPHDTTNPPRKPAALVERLASVLRDGGLAVEVTDHGEGSMSVFATRGTTRTLLTAHVDTVPVAPGWTREPFTLLVEGDRAFGLGACDVKGGAAGMMAAALATDAPCALLFTTDEEAGKATCMRAFASSERGRSFDLAVVGEPTRGRAVLAHRGVATGTMHFEGRAGHSSQRGGESAVHALARWAHEALGLSAQLEGEGQGGLAGVRFNLGRIEGGEKPNVVAARAEARFGVRPPPDLGPRETLARFAALGPAARFEPGFFGPPLPASAELGARASKAAEQLGIPVGEPVDFWTEASLLSGAGIPSLVLGPGDIAQAHGPDEWVLLDELEAAARIYMDVLVRSSNAAGETGGGA